MSHARALLPLALAALNALLVFFVWFGALLALANDPQRISKPVALSLLPVCAVVAWRSRRHVQRIAAGTANTAQAITDGATFGAAIAVGLFLLNWLAPSALAAGHPLEGFRPSQVADWFALLAMLGPLVAIAAVVGAVHGYVLHTLNMFIMRRLNEA